MPEMNREEIAKLEALYASNPEGRVFTHLAEAYRKAGEFERARNILEQGLTKHPAYASAHVVLGRVYADLNEPDQASASFRHVLELDPHNLVALRSLGELARGQGRTDEALHFFEELRHQDPSNTDIEGIIADLKQSPAAPPPAPAAPAETASAFEEIGIHGADGMADPALEPWRAQEPEPAPEPEQAAHADAPAAMDTLPGFEDSTPDYGDLVSPDIDLGWSSAPAAEEALPGDLAGFAGSTSFATPEPDAAAESPPSFELEAEPPIDSPIDLSDFEHLEEAPAYTSSEDPWSMTMDPAVEEPEGPADEEPSVEVVTYAFESVTEIIDVAPPVESPSVESPPVEEPSVEEPPVEEPPVEMRSFEAPEPPSWETPPEPEPASWELPAEPEPVADLPLVTETMAELYTEQGLYDKAAEVYRALMAERPWDPDLPVRMADVAAKARGETPPAAPPVEAEAEKEDEIQSPWMSAPAGAADVPTPYAWMGDKGADAAEDGPPISGYFRSLLAWRPGAGAATEEAPAVMDLDMPVAEPVAISEPPVPEEEPWAAAPAVAAMPSVPPAATPVSDNPVEAAFDEWFNASDFGEETSQPNGAEATPAASQEVPAEAPEDDDDLEMFRSWLQSLKK